MTNNDENLDNHFFYKFRSIDREVSNKVKCLLKGCHRIAKYSISMFKPNPDETEQNTNYKQFVNFICSNHLENWDAIKVSLIENKPIVPKDEE